MTNNSEKLRSLFLTALMVFSVFAGTVALTGNAAAQAGNAEGEALNSGSSYYAGQDVFIDSGLTAGEEYRVRSLDSDDELDSLELTVTADNNGVAEFELDGDLSDGDFAVVNDDGQILDIDEGSASVSANQANASAEKFEVVTQDLSAEFGESSTGNDGGSATVDYEIESSVRNNYVVNVSANDELDTDELSMIFGGENVTQNYSDADNETVTLSLAGEGTAEGDYTANFTDIDAETYTFTANVTDTSAIDSDTIEVTDTGDSRADFNGTNIVSNERGDILNITVGLDNTDTASLQIGEQDRSGYVITTEVVDDDGDGVAYVEFNSFLAGTAGPSDVIRAGDDDTNVENIRQPTNTSFTDTTRAAGENVLDAGDYNMYVAGDEYAGDKLGTGDTDTSGTLSLSDRTTEGAQIWNAPADSLDTLRDTDAAGIAAFANANNLTTSDTIANRTTLVVEVEASGFEGALDQDFLANDVTSNYNVLSSATDADADTGVFNLSISREATALNTGGDRVDISTLGTGAYDVVYNDNEESPDTHYVVIDSGELTDNANPFAGYEDGDDYVANFTVYGDHDDNDLADDRETATDEFSIENAELELDANENDTIEVEQAANQEVTGDTNLAPGTVITVALDSDTSSDPFLKRPEAEVQEDGTFTAVADFSQNAVGSNFTADAVADQLTDVESDEYDGRIVEATGEPEPTVTTTTEQTTTEQTTTEQTTTEQTTTEQTTTDSMGDMNETETMGSNETTEEETTGGSGPGFTAAIALIALIAAALLAVRRDN